jgi:hypothetical protein
MRDPVFSSKPQVLFVLSAKPCDPELQAEFGAVPACLIPIGPKRLLDLQLEQANTYMKTLRHTFVAVPKGFDTPGKELYGDAVTFLEVDGSISLEYTFDQLMRSFSEWYYGSQWAPAVFIEDEWDIHFINGDTLITHNEAWWNLGSCYVDAKDSPFEMSKEFSIYHQKQPRPNNKEYAGKGAYRYSHSAKEADPLHYGSYMNIVRVGHPIPVPKNEWSDFGHSSTYWRSKRVLLSSRSFNRVAFDRRSGYIEKSGGSNEEKIKSEYDWYRNLPEHVAMYAPRVMHRDDRMCTYFKYQMEYLPFPTLAELFVYCNHDAVFWDRIMSELSLLLMRMREGVPTDYIPHDGMFMKKTRERIAGLNHPWIDHAQSMIDWLEPRIVNVPAVVHGDLCFSNILYDKRSNSLKIIDPRGYHYVDGVRGNQFYDIAKLFHSIFGMYDFAVAGFWPSDEAKGRMIWMGTQMLRICEPLGIDVADLMAATSLLFYSMLPLHTDNMERVQRLVGAGNELRMKWMELSGWQPK